MVANAPVLNTVAPYIERRIRGERPKRTRGPVTVQTESGLKEITYHEYKTMMRQFFTVRNGIVQNCGHKIGTDQEPKYKNCEECWFAFFNTHGEFVQAVDEAYNEHGPAFIEKMKGTKFTRMYLAFMSTVAQSLRTRSAIPNVANTPKEKDEQSLTGTVSSDS